MRKKVILFGLIANIDLLFTNELWQDVIFICDNNSSLHGRKVNGVSVIGPDGIHAIEFDEVIVLTWAYNQIKNQLLALNVPSCKISSVNKRLVTKSVFQDQLIRSIALKFISDLCAFSFNCGLNIYIEAGTLLGIVREKDLLQWDTDIDFSVNNADIIPAFELLIQFSNIYNENYKVHINDISNGYSGNGQITGFINIKSQSIPFDLFTRSIEGDLSVSKSGDFFACDAKHFNGIETLIYDDLFFTVPIDYEKYLASVYGSDWRVPKYNFSYADFNYTV